VEVERIEQRRLAIRLGLLAGIVQFGVLAGVQFVSIKIIMNYLGKEAYGAWSILTLIVYWSSLFDLGLSKGLLNVLAEANGQDNKTKAIDATSTTLAILALIAIVGAIATWGMTLAWGDALIKYFKLEIVGARPWVLGMVGTLFFVNMPLSVVTQIYWAYQLRHIAVFFLVASSLMALLSQLAGVHFNLGLNMMVLLFVMPTTLGLLFSGFYLFFVKMPWISPRIEAIKISSIKGMKITSIGYFCFGLTAFLINETQPSIIARIASLSVTAEWQVISRIILSLTAPIQMSTFAFVPVLRESVANGNSKWMKMAFRKMVLIRMGAAILGCVILLYFGPFLLSMLVKRTQIEFTFTIWMAIILTIITFTWNSCFTDLFSIMDRVWLVVWATIINAVSVICFTVYWVPKVGIIGAILSYVAMPLIIFSWVMPWLAWQIFFAGVRDEA
jgi:O-antigen/teichoic acid export membrane protein